MAMSAELLVLHEESPEATWPLIIDVSKMPEDEFTRTRAERLIRSVGSTALKNEIENSQQFTPERKHEYDNLMDAIHAASRGDTQARLVVESNVRTDVVERTIKAGHVMQVKLDVDESGRISQHGQTLENIHLNALRFAAHSPEMRARTEAETRNGVRIENLRRQGLLRNYYFVVFSRYPDNMSDDRASQAGFFDGTKTLAIQAITEDVTTAGLIQESGFVAGLKQPHGEQHDAATVQAVAADFGVSLAGKNATQIIDSPVLVHKLFMPNGVIDLVARCDQKASTFFGENKPPQDYLDYVRICRERERQFEPSVQKIVNQLIAEGDTIQAPIDAVQRLHVLSQRAMVDLAFTDRTINPQVFGEVSARYIAEARSWLERGNIDRFLDARASAQFTARSSSCPNEFLAQKEQGDGDSNHSESKDCEFISKKCPICHKKNVRTRSTKTEIIGIDCGCRVKK